MTVSAGMTTLTKTPDIPMAQDITEIRAILAIQDTRAPALMGKTMEDTIQLRSKATVAMGDMEATEV